VAPGRRLVELIQQRGDEIEGGVHARMGLEVQRHVQVVLGGVQTHPGQQGAALTGAAVVRLMVMPEEKQINRELLAQGVLPERPAVLACL
jgi:hypothetical protein